MGVAPWRLRRAWHGHGRSDKRLAPEAECAEVLSILVHLQGRDEGLLRDLDAAELAHLLLASFLLVQQLAVSRDITAVALGEHVLAECPDGLARDDLGANGGLNRDLEQVRWDQLFQLLAHG